MLTGERGRARLVVLGVEVGCRWSAEASVFFRNLAAAKARGAPPCSRVGFVLHVSVAGRGCSAVQVALLPDVASPGGDGATPSMSAVLGEARYA